MARIRSHSGTAGRIAAILLAVSILQTGGCGEGVSASWLKNGLLDPTQVGDYESQVSSEIRGYLSILEEPDGIEDAEQPTPEDLQPLYVTLPIGPGDMVQFSMYELQQFGATTSLQARVEASGYVTLPVLGRVFVAGFTSEQLEQELQRLLKERDILQKADVQINVLGSQAAQVSLTGQGIGRPGIYALPRPDYRLHELLAAAGGISPVIEKIYIFRRVVPPNEIVGPPGAATESQPASQPTGDLEGMTAHLMMSDTSSTRTSSLDPPPAATEPAIDEMAILEGRATSKPAQAETPTTAPAPVWNPERGEWILQDEPGAATTLAEQPEFEDMTSPPIQGATSRPMTAPEAKAGPSTTTQESPGESGPWDAAEVLEPAIRIIEVSRQALMNGDPSVNIVLRPYDVVQIPAGDVGEYYLGGNIARPGAYTLTGRKLTVKQAITAAGGFNALAWPSRAQLIRKIGPNEEQSIQLDLDAIFAMRAPDFYVKPNDIIQVGTTPLAPFLAVVRSAFRFSYGFGFVYDRNFGDQDTASYKLQRSNYEAQQRALRGLPP